MDDWADARARMVAEQLAARGVRDPRVLEAMRTVPRHLFVPPAQQASAYADHALPIGEGQTISQPYMVAAMTVALGVRETDRVLEIGTGSGYQAAILSVLAREVISLERRPDLSKAAAERLSSHGFANVRVVTADGTRGLEDQAPFDRIIVTAGAPHVPATLKAQLADGARLVIPVGSEGQQRLLVITRRGDEFEQAAFEPCVFVPLIGEHGWPER